MKPNKKINQLKLYQNSLFFSQFLAKNSYEKAAAFVTDEEGILCHAAIIARETKKPCIVGTKNAIKLLKDGDKLEVDANKGTVRILD